MKLSTIITPLGILVAVSAQAQSSPWTVRAGFSGLANNNSVNNLKFEGFTAGLGYDLSRFRQGLSLDINFDTHSNFGNKLESTSGMFVYRAPLSAGQDAENQNYFGFGFGVMNNRLTSSASSSTFSTTKTVGGATFLLGVNVNSSSSLELVLRVSPSIQGVVPNTVGLVYSKHF